MLFKPAANHLHKAEALLCGCRIHVGSFALAGEKPQEVKRIIYAPSPPPVPPWCKDKNKQCPIWAESGDSLWKGLLILAASQDYTYMLLIAEGVCCNSCIMCKFFFLMHAASLWMAGAKTTVVVCAA